MGVKSNVKKSLLSFNLLFIFSFQFHYKIRKTTFFEKNTSVPTEYKTFWIESLREERKKGEYFLTLPWGGEGGGYFQVFFSIRGQIFMSESLNLFFLCSCKGTKGSESIVCQYLNLCLSLSLSVFRRRKFGQCLCNAPVCFIFKLWYSIFRSQIGWMLNAIFFRDL